MLDRQDAKPLHIQFEQALRHRLDDGEWTPDQMIPSENELSRQYQLSRMTVRAVLNRLVAAGLIYRVPGKGTFVAAPKIESLPLTRHGIREQLEEQGYALSTRLLSCERIPASPKIQQRLALAQHEPVFSVRRLRSLDGEPLSAHLSFIPAALAPDLGSQPLEEMQLCSILEQRCGHPILRRVETLESVTASPEEAELLRLRPSHPLLMLENIVYTSHQTPLEYTKVLFRGDRIKLRLEYNQDAE